MNGISTQSIASLLIDVAATQAEDANAALGQIKEALSIESHSLDQARVGLDQALEQKMRASSSKAKLKAGIKETRARRLVESRLSHIQDTLKEAGDLALASGRVAERFSQAAANVASAAEAITQPVAITLVTPTDVSQAMTAQAGDHCQSSRLVKMGLHMEQGRRKTTLQKHQAAQSRQLKAMEKLGIFGKILKFANLALMPLAMAAGGLLTAPLAAGAAASTGGFLTGLGISGNALLTKLLASLPSTALSFGEQAFMAPFSQKLKAATQESQSALEGLTTIGRGQDAQAWLDAQIQKASEKTLQNLEQSAAV